MAKDAYGSAWPDEGIMMTEDKTSVAKLAWDVPRLEPLGTMDDVRGGLDQPPNDGTDLPDVVAS